MTTDDDPAPSCFISYRHEDSFFHTSRLFDALRDRLGERVFIDVDGIAGGRDFVDVIEAALIDSDVVVAVIGPGWLDAGAPGPRRLDDPSDVLRRELELTFDRGKGLLPVLVNGATMPKEEDLPETIRPLARVNAIALDDRRWNDDLERLFSAISDLVPEPAGRDLRRQATVLMVNLDVESGDGEPSDPEVAHAVEARTREAIARILREYEATPYADVSGGVAGLFGVPDVHDDDALRALRAAQAIDAVADEVARSTSGPRPVIRLGVRTGTLLMNTGSGLPTGGEAFRGAGALAARAPHGEILIDEETSAAVGDAILTREDGSGNRLLLAVSERTVPRKDSVALVGRSEELTLLESTFDRVVADRTSAVFTISGEPGIGKSRLAAEFVRGVGSRALVLQGRCLAYGTAATYWPVAEALRAVLGVSPDDDAATVRQKLAGALRVAAVGDPRWLAGVAHVLGVGETVTGKEESFAAVRRAVEILADGRPVVFVVDDLQWAEPTLIDLLEHLIDWMTSSQIMVVALARPELRDLHPDWASAFVNTQALTLMPLGSHDTMRLIQSVLGSDGDHEGVERLAARSGGNPLFAEELASADAEGGGASPGDDVPDPLRALLEARIHALTRTEQEALERAAVIGQVFSPVAVRSLTPDRDRSAVDAAIVSLRRRDLVRTLSPEEFEFRHLLIRDAAYERVPKRSRAVLHEGYGDWLEASRGDRLAEVDEILGFHLEQAVLYLRELGDAADPHARRAAVVLDRAGRRAFASSDMPAAVSLLERGARLLPDGDPMRLSADLERGEALYELGELRASSRLFASTADAAASADAAVAARAALGAAFADAVAGEVDDQVVLDRIASSAAVLHEAGDRAGLARAGRVRATVLWWRPDFPAAMAALDEALAHAHAAGDDREVEAIWSLLTHGLIWDDTPVDAGLARIATVIADPPSLRVRAKALQARACLLAMAGRDGEARSAIMEADQMLADLGLALARAVGAQTTATVELLAGEPGRAEEAVRGSLPALETVGDEGYLATAWVYVARALLAQGQEDEAGEAVARAASYADPDEPAERADWGPVSAHILARAGDGDAAAALAAEAVEVFGGAGMLLDLGNALLALAEARRVLGDRSGASEAAAEASAVFARKGLAGGRGSLVG